MIPFLASRWAGYGLAGIAVLAVLFGCYLKGRLDERERCAERLNVERAEHYKRALAEQQKAVDAAAEWGRQNGRQKTVVRTVVKEVEKLVAANADAACFTDDGVRLVNAAIDAGVDPAVRDPGPLPAPPAFTRWAGEYGSYGDGGHDRQILRMPGEARSPRLIAQSNTEARERGTAPK